MWQLSKKFTFEASHQLPNHDGKCRRLHGHSWTGWVNVQGDTLAEQGAKGGMVMDYSDLKAAVQPIVEEMLDHHHLNNTLPLINPTSEAIAQWMYLKLKPLLPGLASVTIEETCTSKCRYSEVAA